MTFFRFALPSLIALTLPLAACGGDDGGETIEPTYEKVEQTLMTSCSFSTSCHGGAGSGRAMLNFQTAIAAGDFREVLVGEAACEYDFMPRVDPGNPENSWLMIKIAGAHDGDGNLEFTPDPGWDHGLTPDAGGDLPPSTCPLTEGGEISFGDVMPLSIGTPMPLSDARIEMFRQWIAAGAPGPGE